ISNDPSVHMPRGEHSRVKAALGREPSRSDVEDPAWLGSWVDLGELRATAAEAGMELERSEEHTSELQSRFELVCRLLLEKKKGHELQAQHINACRLLRAELGPAHDERLPDRYQPQHPRPGLYRFGGPVPHHGLEKHEDAQASGVGLSLTTASSAALRL